MTPATRADLENKINNLREFLTREAPGTKLFNLATADIARMERKLGAPDPLVRQLVRVYVDKALKKDRRRCPECGQLLTKHQSKSEKQWRLNKERNIL